MKLSFVYYLCHHKLKLIKAKKMNYADHIVRDPSIMLGKPSIKGSRITVELIMRKLSSGYSVDDMLSSYPNLTHSQILAAFEYAAEVIANEEVIEV